MLLFPLHRNRPSSRRAQSDLRHDHTTATQDLTAPPQLRDAQVDPQAQLQPQQRLRGVIGYHNAFTDPSVPDPQEDALPPTYGSKLVSTRLQRTQSLNYDTPVDIPAYDCSVFMQSVCDYKLEKENPFEFLPEQKWLSRFAVLTGTQLCLHEVRKPNPLALAANPSLPKELPGKLVKKYTLQHAEVGLAADHKKFLLVPKSALVNLLSHSATEHLMATEPHKFDKVYQYVVRVRVETHQILLRFAASSTRNDWINALAAAIDIAQPLETRAEPKFVTLPRRRRRRVATNNLDAMRDDQMRIAREQFPHLVGGVPAEEEAEPDTVHDVDDGRQVEPGAAEHDDSEHGHPGVRSTAEPRAHSHSAPVPPSGEATSEPTTFGGVALNALAQAGFATPLPPHAAVSEAEQQLQPEAPTDFDDLGKWAPHIPHDTNQEARIRRRCMPSLLYNSKRSGNVIICNGQRVRIDWQAQELRPWPELPPSYAVCTDSDLSADGALSDDEIQLFDEGHPHIGHRSRRNGVRRRATATGTTELRIETQPMPPVPRLADDTASGSSDGSLTPASGRFLGRLPRILRRITSRPGPLLKMTHGNKSYAGNTGKERVFGLHEETVLVNRVPSHASSIAGRDDTSSALRKIRSAMHGASVTELDHQIHFTRGHAY